MVSPDEFAKVLVANASAPDWLVVGALVRIPGGPIWEVVMIDLGEVHITERTGDRNSSCAWKLRNFLACWEHYVPDRFERDEVL